MINFAPFGGCGLHNPVGSLRRLKVADSVFGQMGFQNSPFSLSANANLQLLDFVTGNLDIPECIRRLTYADRSHRPSDAQGAAIHDSDIVLVEMSTPIEYLFDSHLLNINLFEEVMLQELASLAAHKKLISSWRSSLLKGREDVRAETAAQLYQLVPHATEQQENLARFIRDTRTRILDANEMTNALGELRDRLGKPMGLVLHNFQFMPDGRPVSWPPEFKAQSAEVAKRLDMPNLDFAEFVGRHGVGRVMAADRRHWEPRFYPRIAEHLYDFAASVLGRSSMREQIAEVRESERSAAMDYLGQADSKDAKAAGKAHAPSLARYLFDYETAAYLPDTSNTVHVVIVLGNAWANGACADEEDQLPATVGCEHQGHALSFDEGVRPNGKPVRAFVDLHESVVGSSKETPCSGIADQVIRNCDDRFAEKPTMLFFVCSDPASTVAGLGISPEAGLMRGSRQHAQVLRYVQRASQIAAEAGKRAEVVALCLVAGERDVQQKQFNASEFERQLSLLQKQYDCDLRRLTGQADPVRMLVTQTNRTGKDSLIPPAAAAQLRVELSNPDIRCVGPTYAVPTEIRASGHPLYPKPIGYRRLGQMLGRFILDDIWGPGRSALYATGHYWTDPRTLRLRFTHPVVVETGDSQVRVSDLGPGAGIVFDDGTEWSPKVEQVSSVKGLDDELEIKLSSPSTGFNKRVMIAAIPTVRGSTGNLTGARSAIRSRRPFDHDPLDGVDLYDWACMQELPVP